MNEYKELDAILMETRLEGAFNKYTLISERQNAGYTQKQFAELLGVHYQTLQKWENGTNEPSVRYLFKMAKILKTPLVFFFT